MATEGTWDWYGLKLPDLGLTEAVLGGVTDNPNLVNPAVTQYMGGTETSQPAAPTNFTTGSVPTTGTFTTSGGGEVLGGQTGGGDSEIQQLQKIVSETGGDPTQIARLNELMQQQPSAPALDYDALIAPALQALDEAIAPQESSYAANVADIEASAGSQRRDIGQMVTSGERTAETSKTTQKRLGESAIDEARRQYAEMSQGLQSRYGGTTGTGRFASEMLGSQAMRNIGKVRQQISTAIQGIDDKLMEIKEIGGLQMQDIEEKTQSMKLQAKAQLDQALNQIRMAKGELMANKAQYAQQAIQFYQTQLQQVNAANAQFKQQLYLQQQEAQQKLLSAQTRAKAAADKITYGIVGYKGTIPTYGWINQTQQTVTPAYGGAGQMTETGQEEDDFID